MSRRVEISIPGRQVEFVLRVVLIVFTLLLLTVAGYDPDTWWQAILAGAALGLHSGLNNAIRERFDR